MSSQLTFNRRMFILINGPGTLPGGINFAVAEILLSCRALYMKILDAVIQRSMWRSVFHANDGHSTSRCCLLYSIMAQAVVNGLTTGVFYSGYLGSYGIDIVGISVLTLLPHAVSLFSLLSPSILERFSRRKTILTVSRILFYVINILGTSLLPILVTGQKERMMGLIAIIFAANTINALTVSGYSAWHMPYIDKTVRSGYFTATALVSTVFSGVFSVAAGLVTDSFTGEARQTAFLVSRLIAFLIALLDVYFLQKPPEPVYQRSSEKHPSLIQTLTLPFRCRKFMLAMSVYFLLTFIGNLTVSVIHTWLVQDVRVSYSYISAVNLCNMFFILPTSIFWRKVMAKRGTFITLSLAIGFSTPALFIHALMTHENYLIVMLLVKLIQYALSLGSSITNSNLIYLALPEEDRTCYLTFYQILGSAGSLLGMSIGTWVVAAMGDSAMTLFGFSFTSVPVLLLLQTVLYFLLVPYILRVGRELEPEYIKRT